MKVQWIVPVALVTCTAFCAGPASGAGYSIYEQGAAVLGMAGAGVASVHDASALFFNPAALTRLEGTQVYAGGSLLTPVTSFAGVDPYPGFGVTEEMERNAFFPPTVYASRRFGTWAAAAGVNSPFGLGVEWKNPSQFTGRYIVTRADLTVINATVDAAYAPNPTWSVAAGGNALFAKVRLENRTLATVPGGGGAQVDVAETKLTSDYHPDYGWNAALAFTPTKQWRLGATYRSKVILHVDDGTADFTQIPTGDPTFDAGVRASLPPDQTVRTVLRFPATWSAGVAWLPVDEWTIEADANFFEWSVFTDLPIRFEDTPSANRTIVEDYSDSWQVRLGAEHRLSSYTYRFGYYFDQAAAPDESVTPILPDADRHGATLGLGFEFGPDHRWGLDVYDLAVFVVKRSTNHVERDGYDGEYKTFVNSAGLGLAYRW